MECDVITLAHGQERYRDLLDQIRSDQELVDRMWADAESLPGELDKPGTYWTVTLAAGAPVAWAAARIITEDSRLVLKGMCNYEVPAWRGRGLYEMAYRQRRLDVILSTDLPAVTYLFGQPPGSELPHGTPIEQHISDGWYLSGLSGRGALADHWWYELRRDPA